MPGSNGANGPNDEQIPFGAALETVLRQQCHERLGPVSWFRTDWQRSRAATGYVTITDEQGVAHDAVVKLPVAPVELQWLQRLQAVEGLVPALHAHGSSLGDYDIAWVVMERLPQGPLSTAWDGAEFDLLVEAAGRFYAATQPVPLKGEPRRKDWPAILKKARDNVRRHSLQNEQRWAAALKKAHKKLKKWTDKWEARPIEGYCHGDLHLFNAMTRSPAPDGPAVLFDFSEVRPGHWLEDAVYLEHLFWARRERLGDRKLCSMLAKERKKHDLPVDANWPDLASIARALLAMSTPAMLHVDGSPPHVQAALEVLEREVG